MNRIFKAAVLLLAFTTFGGAVFGQSFRGTILGTARDASGAVLPGVAITVTNTGTNISRMVLTNEAGDYVFTELNIGAYTVSGEFPGFKTALVSNLQLDVDQRLRADLAMAIGDVSEKVLVTADAQLVASDSASVGAVVENRTIVELPLNKRDFLNLALLTPGAVTSYSGSNLSAQGGGIAVNGFRETMNNIMLDGVEDREMGIDQITINLAVDAMAEMKVQSSSYSAEYGRQAGAQINMTTKSGTNNFHGTLYEFFRNGHLDAKNFFDPSFYPKPQYLRNVFGASVGGPIKHDKAFFFFNYDGTRIKQGVTRLGVVPTALERAGDFSKSAVTVRNPYTGLPFDGNVVPQSLIDPVGRNVMNLYPLPNLTSGSQNFVSSPSGINNRNQYTGRIDYKLNDNNSLFMRYTYNDEFLRNPFGRSAATSPCTVCIAGTDGVPYGEFSYVPGHVLGISLTHVFSPRLFSETRFGFNRLDGGIYPGHYQISNGSALLGIRNTQIKCPTRCTSDDPAALGYPQFSVSGFSGIGEGGDQDRRDNTYQFVQGVSYNTGSHSIKVGGEYRLFQKNRTDSGGQGSFSFNGTYSNSGLADLLLGLPNTASQNIPILGYTDNIAVHTRQSGMGVYAQDDWRFNSHLTFNLGMRWDATSPGRVSDNKQTNFDFNTGQLIFSSKEHPYLVPWDLNNFGPRFGFALTPFNDPRTVIRAGYGVFFDAKTNVTWNSFATNPPYTNGYTYQNTAFGVAGPFSPKFTLSNLFPADPKTAASAPAISYTMLQVGQKLPDGYGQQFSLNVQREVAPNLLVEVGYVGTKGTSLDSSLQLNQPAPGPGTIANRRPYPQYSNLTLDTAAADSNYHSAQIRVEKRYSRGISFLGSYTFAKNIDNTSATGGGPLDPLNGRGDRGLSNNDIRHRLSYSYSWDLPFKATALRGWQLSGVLAVQTGQPLTVTIPTDRANVGRTGQRPNAIGDPNLPSDQRTPNRWFDASVFTTPDLYTFGNAGRNTIEGPGLANIDFSVSRNFRFGEQKRLQFRAEAFNIANHPNFNNPSTSLDSSVGVITGAKDSRQFQFGLKFYY